MLRKLKSAARRILGGLIGSIALAGGAHALADSAPPDADRQAILAMAGDYAVTFDFRETLALREGYKLAEPKLANGREVVRVIADDGGTISLQHLLVVARDGKTNVVKHWRQDWAYEPRTLLEYASDGVWKTRQVAPEDARGRWSQTVWQTDDSPRYGALGAWRHEGGVSTWTSGETRRPLPRRDATRNPPYSWYRAVNRHVITPSGWAHEQENEKIGLAGGAPAAFAREYGLNTYTRQSFTEAAAADAYWQATKSYWSAVRAGWDSAAADGVTKVREEADRGSRIAARLMDLADEVAEKKTSEDAAISDARTTIAAEDALDAPGSDANQFRRSPPY